jgi:type I restriction enzyme R subunit
LNQAAILTTSQMLTTGLDAPTCKNVVLVRMVNSMSEFKQIIGRGTRVRDDYGKLWFSILDYTGRHPHVRRPDFDNEPALLTEQSAPTQPRGRPRGAEPERLPGQAAPT